MMFSKKFICLCFVVCYSSSASAIEVFLSAAKDSSIFEDQTSNSSGEGDFLFVGNTGNRNQAGPSSRRGLIQFDIAGAVPAGAVIDSATLLMTIGRVPDEKFLGTDQFLHRVIQDWGNPSSNSIADPDNRQGNGVPARTGDATWLDSEFGSESWTQAGGDYIQTASAVTGIPPQIDAQIGWTSAQLTSDVQLWLDEPDTNFGWILIGNENFTKNARGYYSSDNQDPAAVGRAPLLVLNFTPIPEPSYLLAIAGVACIGIFKRRRIKWTTG